MRAATACLALLLAATSAAPARANDSTAALSTGGLVYVLTEDIEMQSEDLFISLDEVRVRYTFENHADHDVTTLVAFPMPDIQGSIDFMVSIPVEDPQNFLGFKTTVDGKPVETKVQQRASALGIDQTALLTSLGVPLALHLDATRKALDALPQADKENLVQLGLAAIDEYDNDGKGMVKHLAPNWLLSTVFYREQTFPAGKRIVVEHSYRPSVGQSADVSFVAPEAQSEPWFEVYRQKYCMDDAFLKAARAGLTPDGGNSLFENRVSYVLRTGSNWAGPIARFRLVVDKGSPRNLVSFCAEGVKKIGPTQFEVVKTNFEPQQDLDIMILQPRAEAP
ncbi:DUF4424 domain-containing protein [Kaistia nematophila]|uniref:DUF4424 domain-containing protein n=1 Tax=Kaistia nematophila TaxID=2994654 RepID=A0A9X3E1M5_9HYPH|nr:DUF4424 domain-containing protein [Kaistia nematophila]MCX5569438.1 DUF4424 domain-containing protein [Kaistia nematophila]